MHMPADKEFPRPAWEHEADWFFAAWSGMGLLARHAPRHPLLTRLALARPGICQFAGRGYWLARKAFIACLRGFGSGFIHDHFPDIRLLLIGYAVQRLPFSVTDLHALRNLVLSEENPNDWQISQADLLGIIDGRLAVPGEIESAASRLAEGMSATRHRGETRQVIPFGFPELDAIFHGLVPGELTVIGGKPKLDELTFGLNLLLNIAGGEHPSSVLLWSGELPRPLVVRRLLALQAARSWECLCRSPSLGEEAAQVLEGMPLLVREDRFPKLEEVWEEARAARQEGGTQVLLLDVSLCMLGFESKICGSFSDMMTKMREMAQELKLAVVCLSQGDREFAPPRKQGLSREPDSSPVAGTVFDNFLTLLRQPLEARSGPAPRARIQVFVLRQTTGPTGSCLLEFDTESGRMGRVTHPRPSPAGR